MTREFWAGTRGATASAALKSHRATPTVRRLHLRNLRLLSELAAMRARGIACSLHAALGIRNSTSLFIARNTESAAALVSTRACERERCERDNEADPQGTSGPLAAYWSRIHRIE